jgi:hypothetical protein
MTQANSAPAALPGTEDFSTRPRVGAEGFDKGQAIKQTNFSHEQLIDELLARPRTTQKELAAKFGYSEGWMCRLVNSDAFQARLGARKSELVDQGLARRLNARLEGVTLQALDTLSRKLDASDSADIALEALGLAVGGMKKVKGE